MWAMASAKLPQSTDHSSAPLEATDDAHLIDEDTVHRRVDVRALFEAAGNHPPHSRFGSPRAQGAAAEGAAAPEPDDRCVTESGVAVVPDPLSPLFGWLIASALLIALTAFAAGYVVSSTWGRSVATVQASTPSSVSPPVSPSSTAVRGISSAERGQRVKGSIAAILASQSSEAKTDSAAILRVIAQLDAQAADHSATAEAAVLRDTVHRVAQNTTSMESLARSGKSLAFDMLYAVWASQMPVDSSGTLALKLLRSAEVRPRVSRELELLLALSDDRPECATLLELLPRVAEIGDERVVPLLARLVQMRNCGSNGQKYCFQCLRMSGALRGAMLKAARRKHPLG